MENDNLIAGLICKKAEITAQVKALQIQLRQLIMDADHIDGAFRVFNPEIDLMDIRPRTVPRSQVAFLGEGRRTTLNMPRVTCPLFHPVATRDRRVLSPSSATAAS